MVTTTVSISQMPHHSSFLIKTLCIMQEEILVKNWVMSPVTEMANQRYTISGSCSEETHLYGHRASLHFVFTFGFSFILEHSLRQQFEERSSSRKSISLFLWMELGFCRSVWLRWRITVTWNKSLGTHHNFSNWCSGLNCSGTVISFSFFFLWVVHWASYVPAFVPDVSRLVDLLFKSLVYWNI